MSPWELAERGTVARGRRATLAGHGARIVAVAVGASLLYWGCNYRVFGEDVVKRSPRRAADVPRYGDELRAQELNPPEPSGAMPKYSGAGGYLRWSPDQSFLAVTTDAAGYYRTVNVWSERNRRLTPVVSIKDSDPESGRAYRYAWSQDSAALLIYGSGGLATAESPSPLDLAKLCLVYQVERDELYLIDPCTRTRWAY